MIGLPLAWFATERCLSSFVERAPMGGGALLYALGCVGVVALVAVRMSPALALRD